MPSVNHFGGREGARNHQDVPVHNTFHRGGVEARAGDEMRARIHAPLRMVHVENGSSADDHVVHRARQLRDHLHRAGNRHGDFDDWNSARANGARNLKGGIRRSGAHHRNNPDIQNALEDVVLLHRAIIGPAIRRRPPAPCREYNRWPAMPEIPPLPPSRAEIPNGQPGSGLQSPYFEPGRPQASRSDRSTYNLEQWRSR